MARGKARVNYLGRAGLVASQDQPDWSFLYEASTVKHPHYNIGDRVVLPDGRVFRYAKASGTVQTYKGQHFKKQIAIAYTTVLQAQAVGDKSLKIDAGAAAAVAEDELRGGYIVIYQSGDNHFQNRGIVGNTLADADGYTTIYLDGPLAVELASGTTPVEVFHNPYAAINACDGTYHQSVAGVPAIRATDGQYFWLQTWGFTWISPSDAGSGAVADERQLVFDSVGAVFVHVTGYTTKSYQHAGFLVDATNPGTDSCPLIMLQISP